MLTQAAALDFAAEGIRCNAYAPGAIDTPMLAHSFEAFDYREAAARRLWGPHLIRRLGRAGQRKWRSWSAFWRPRTHPFRPERFSVSMAGRWHGGT